MAELKTAKEVREEILKKYFVSKMSESGNIRYFDFAGNSYPTDESALQSIIDGTYNKPRKRGKDKMDIMDWVSISG
ncbi:MAG: hypothetical protein QW286_03000 [Candidatus Aenigmatarchaeota archaeon]